MDNGSSLFPPRAASLSYLYPPLTLLLLLLLLAGLGIIFFRLKGFPLRFLGERSPPKSSISLILFIYVQTDPVSDLSVL